MYTGEEKEEICQLNIVWSTTKLSELSLQKDVC